jgi:hypothetical protein
MFLNWLGNCVDSAVLNLVKFSDAPAAIAASRTDSVHPRLGEYAG